MTVFYQVVANIRWLHVLWLYAVQEDTACLFCGVESTIKSATTPFKNHNNTSTGRLYFFSNSEAIDMTIVKWNSFALDVGWLKTVCILFFNRKIKCCMFVAYSTVYGWLTGLCSQWDGMVERVWRIYSGERRRRSFVCGDPLQVGITLHGQAEVSGWRFALKRSDWPLTGR